MGGKSGRSFSGVNREATGTTIRVASRRLEGHTFQLNLTPSLSSFCWINSRKVVITTVLFLKKRHTSRDKCQGYRMHWKPQLQGLGPNHLLSQPRPCKSKGRGHPVLDLSTLRGFCDASSGCGHHSSLVAAATDFLLLPQAASPHRICLGAKSLGRSYAFVMQVIPISAVSTTCSTKIPASFSVASPQRAIEDRRTARCYA